MRVIFTCSLSVTAMDVILIYLLHGRSAAYIAVCTNNRKNAKDYDDKKIKKPLKWALLNVRQLLRKSDRSFELWKRKKKTTHP